VNMSMQMWPKIWKVMRRRKVFEYWMPVELMGQIMIGVQGGLS